jgi:hypothetical protein
LRKSEQKHTHRDTEDTEAAQKRPPIATFCAKLIKA